MGYRYFRDALANKIGNSIKNVKGGHLGRQRFFLTRFIYSFLPLLGLDYNRGIEWAFVLRNIPRNKKINILDVGSTSSLFIYELASRGKVMGMDFRPYTEKLPKEIDFLCCDAAVTALPENSFDYISMISVIEHIGMGAYNDPVYVDGDFKVMLEMKRILKEKGIFLLTTNISDSKEPFAHWAERVYTKERLMKLIAGFHVLQEHYYVFKGRWVEVDKDTAFSQAKTKFSLVCLKLEK